MLFDGYCLHVGSSLADQLTSIVYNKSHFIESSYFFFYCSLLSYVNSTIILLISAWLKEKMACHI